MSENEVGACPVCGGLKALVLFSIQTSFSRFDLVRCQRCHLTQTYPFPTDKSLRDHGTSNYYGSNSTKFIPLLQRIRNGIMKFRAKYYLSYIPSKIEKPKVLDIGCAEGRLLSALLDYGCECFGIEHPHFPADRFLNKDRILYFQDAFRSFGPIEGGFDLIFLWHVLEHMDDPRGIFNRLYKLLGPDGVLVLAVPNFSGLESKRFKDSWFQVDIPWHKYHFNEQSIGYLIKEFRFKIVRSSTLCFEIGLYGLIQSVLNSMGWPKNEFYEALKGNLKSKRVIHYIIQFFIIVSLIIPGGLVVLLTSIEGKGSVLKLILKKDE